MSEQQQARSMKRSWRALLACWIIDPPASVTDPDIRARLRLFSALGPVFFVLTLVFEVVMSARDAGHSVNYGAFVSIIGAYALGRLGRLRTAVAIAAGSFPAILFARIISGLESHADLALYPLVAALFIAALLLSTRAVAILAVSQMTVMALIPLVSPRIFATPAQITGPLVTNGVAAVLILFFLRRRDRAAAERAAEIRDSEERMRLALDGARTGTWEWDVATESVVWSERTESLFGLAPGSFPNNYTAYLELVHPDDRAAIERLVASALSREKTDYRIEYRVSLPDGSIRWHEARGRVLFDPKGVARRMIGSVTDVTGRKRAEEARNELERRVQHAQKLESLGVLAGGIAHDFNNLLMAIMGHIDLARLDAPQGSPARQHIDEAGVMTQRAADLTHQLLAYSGKGKFQIEPIDLSRLVCELTSLLRVSVHRTIRIETLLAPKLPPIAADAAQIRQVIMNLIVNASEAIGAQPGVITLTTGARTCQAEALAQSRLPEKPSPGEFIFVEVADTGCGMDAETQRRLFDPFFTTKSAGRGLGMAAVQGILGGHKGAIFLMSRPGQGSRFTVLLPSAPGMIQAIRPSQSVVEERVTAMTGQGLILLVDDEESVRSVCGDMLDRLGFPVLTASTGLEAIELFRKRAEEIQCVVLDLTMPGMDGAATLIELARIRKDVPVIIASGYDQQDVASKLAGNHVAAFIEKPFHIATLRATVEKALTCPART